MPASYVHQCIAQSACRALSVYTEKPLLDAVLAGAEGPDPLFFSVLRPSVPRLGSILHTQKTDDFLLALADACRHSELLRAYCCGFFTHYAADTTFHPFIYAHSLTEDGSYSSTLHCTLEHQLETLHYRRQGHVKGLPVQMGGFAALTRTQRDEIARALSAAITAVFPGDALPLHRVRASFDDSIALCTLLRSERGVKFSALGALLRPFRLDAPLHAHMMPREAPDADIMNDARAPWRSLWAADTIRTESFDDLMQQAVSRAAALMQAADSYMRDETSYATLRALHGGFSYDSGMPWATTCSAREAAKTRK
ncbi:MAG: zinc dependent phospholipase C family protein [Clostridia bacterium]|nr:zinc dependent phospholipase C family protein [Clostridia bacterium]